MCHCDRVEDRYNCFQHMTSWNWLASSTPIGNMLLRKMLPNALPLFVRQPNYSSFISGSTAIGNFDRGSTHNASCSTGLDFRKSQFLAAPMFLLLITSLAPASIPTYKQLKPRPTLRLLNLVARSRPLDRDDALALHTMVKRRSEECVSLSRIRWRLAASGSGLSRYVLSGLLSIYL